MKMLKRKHGISLDDVSAITIRIYFLLIFSVLRL